MTVTLLMGTSSSSATICAIARSVLWPPSILPKNTVTAPFGAIASQESSSVGTRGGLPSTATACASTLPASAMEKATIRAPVLCSSVRRESERSVCAFIGISSRHLVGGALDRAHDRRVGAATAFDAGQGGADFGVRRLLLVLEERCRG